MEVDALVRNWYSFCRARLVSFSSMDILVQGCYTGATIDGSSGGTGGAKPLQRDPGPRCLMYAPCAAPFGNLTIHFAGGEH